MGDFLDFFKQKKNLINLLLLGILVLALPIVISLVRQQQLLKSKAAADPIVFVGDNVVQKAGGWVALKPQISLEITSPLGSPVAVRTARWKDVIMDLLTKGLVKTAYAQSTCEDGHNAGDTWPACQGCDEGTWTCNGGTNYTWNSVKNPSANCGAGCGGGGTCDNGAAVGATWPECHGCDEGVVTCNGGSNYGWTSVKNPSANCGANCVSGGTGDGPGGCCSPGNPTDGQGDNCRSWERCDIANGGCPAGFSCRSTVGCGRDSDCGPGNFCDGGVCKPGNPSGGCQSTSSLQARYQLNSSDAWAATKQTTLGKTVNAAVFRSGTGDFAGAPIGPSGGPTYTPTDVSARINGPGVSNLSIDVSKSNPFTPPQAGTYTINATCGNNVTGSATLTVTGTTSPSPGVCNIGNQTPDMGDSCATCFKTQDANLINSIKSGNPSLFNTCSDKQLLNYWCNGGYGSAASTQCASWKSGACASACGGTTTSPSPNPTGNTVAYRIAENPTDLNTAIWQQYTADGMRIDYEFKDQTPGLKTVFVEFKDSSNPPKTERRSTQIQLLGAGPVVENCLLTFDKDNTTLNLTGQGFGTTQGTVKNTDNASLQIKEWKVNSVKVLWPNAPQGQTLTVNLTNSDGQSVEGQCSSIVQLSVGAKVFCRQPSRHETKNVQMILAGVFSGGAKVKQTVSIDKDGVIQGMNQKLEGGKKYKISLKAPKSLRTTSEEFTAGDEGDTNVPNFVLPIGDIFPLDGGDSRINAFDHNELVREWVIAIDKPNRAADFNQDNRVNSFDWACMRFSMKDAAGRGDDPEPAAGGPAASSSASPRVSPSPSPSTCNPPVYCETPPAGCSYEGGNSCNCGTLVCPPVSPSPSPATSPSPGTSASPVNSPSPSTSKFVLYWGSTPKETRMPLESKYSLTWINHAGLPDGLSMGAAVAQGYFNNTYWPGYSVYQGAYPSIVENTDLSAYSQPQELAGHPERLVLYFGSTDVPTRQALEQKYGLTWINHAGLQPGMTVGYARSVGIIGQNYWPGYSVYTGDRNVLTNADLAPYAKPVELR